MEPTAPSAISASPECEWVYQGDDLMGEHQLQVWVCAICNEWDMRESS